MKPHFKDTTSNIKMSDTWKIQLSTAINYVSSKDTDEQCKIFPNRDNIRGY